MRILLGIAGFCIVLVTVVDLLWTTFLEGAGPISLHVASRIGRLVLACHRFEKGSRRIITKAGLLTVIGTLFVSANLMWVGCGLIFCASPDALVFAENHQPAGWWGRLYFAGTTLTTLGLGDYRPEGTFWEIFTAITGASGFVLIGLVISYIVPVVSAATQKRQLAVCIWALGRSPDDIIIRAYNGVDTTALVPHLISLIPMLALLGESHLTYPVLHFFHSSKRSSAIAPSIAALDEALTILECGMQQGCSLDVPSLGAARESIDEFLKTLKPALVETGAAVPPSPSLARLRDAGVPVVDDKLFAEATVGLAERRRLLTALVVNEGWTWESVWPKPQEMSEALPVFAEPKS